MARPRAAKRATTTTTDQITSWDLAVIQVLLLREQEDQRSEIDHVALSELLKKIERADFGTLSERSTKNDPV